MNLDPYFAFAGFTLFLFFIRYWRDKLALLLIFVCYHGFFAYYGKDVENLYKILIALYAFYLFLHFKLSSEIKKGDRNVLVAFILFSFSFFVSGMVNQDPTILILSQYFSKFLLVFISFFLFKKVYFHNPQKFISVKHLFIQVIIVQVLLSLYKYVNYNMIEGIVGTLSSAGGSIATTFPVYAIIIIWLNRKGKLRKRDWLILFSIFFIGFSSNKRAIWFIMPILFFLILIYIPQRRVLLKAAFLLPLMALIFYVGVRLNPSLNPEEKIWGSFDLNYMMDYTTNYSLGPEDFRDEEVAYGRISSALQLTKKVFSFQYSTKDLLGLGQDVTRSTTYDEFLDYDTGLGTKMALNGFYRSYITAGFIGVFTILFWFWFMVKNIRLKRFKIVMILILVWDYFFYHGNSMDNMIIMVMVTYIIWVSNYMLSNRSSRISKTIRDKENQMVGPAMSYNQGG